MSWNGQLTFPVQHGSLPAGNRPASWSPAVKLDACQASALSPARGVLLPPLPVCVTSVDMLCWIKKSFCRELPRAGQL